MADGSVVRRSAALLSRSLDARARNTWARLSVQGSSDGAGTFFYVTLHDEHGNALTDDLHLRGGTAERSGIGDLCELVAFVPADACEARCHGMGSPIVGRRIALTVQPLRPGQAAWWLLLNTGWTRLSRLVRVVPRGSGTRTWIRQLLAAMASDALTPGYDYPTWVALFDNWSEDDLAADASLPSIAFLVFARAKTSEALAATLRSLEEQHGGRSRAVVHYGVGPSPAELSDLASHDYVGVLQAGEVLPRHATRLAARELARLALPEIAIADEDAIGLDGQRHSPQFKPTPADSLMLSGILSRGLWLAKATALRRAPPREAWAEAWRLALWFGRGAGRTAASVARIPFILCHRRPDAEAAPPAAVAATVNQHLALDGPSIAPLATWPLSFALTGKRKLPRVTAIVPSTLRGIHASRCIAAIAEQTDYPFLQLHVTVMQPGRLDAGQEAAADLLQRLPNVTVTWMEAPSFNFSQANNAVASLTQGGLLLLLNDDVSPIRPDWLRWMVAFLDDPGVGIVGARLLYPDDSVQHAGVIMGLSGLCDHAHRHLPAGEPGYMCRAVVAGDYSAVTAACMLVRRDLYEHLGGLDVNYPSAFNDVDFSLRVGEAGHAVVCVPQAALHHHELQTYGSHYAGARAAFHDTEVRRMRARWAARCAADPFHNPNLRLITGQEWQLAFPPRHLIGPDA